MCHLTPLLHNLSGSCSLLLSEEQAVIMVSDEEYKSTMMAETKTFAANKERGVVNTRLIVKFVS